MRTPAYLFAIIAAISCMAADMQYDITGPDGHVHRDAALKDLRPEGVAFEISSGLVVIPYDALPPSLQTQYGPIPEELKKALPQLSGTYSSGPGEAGSVIELKGNEFIFSGWTDIPVPEHPPTRGKFSIKGNWIIFHHRELQDYPCAIVIVSDKIALMGAKVFKDWRDTGKAKRWEYHLKQ